MAYLKVLCHHILEGRLKEITEKRPGIRSGDFLNVKEALPTPEQCLVTADKLE